MELLRKEAKEQTNIHSESDDFQLEEECRGILEQVRMSSKVKM